LSNQEENVQTLNGLGLTRCQAKVYLTLTSLGRADVKTIWKNSGVARQEIYRTLDELQKKGVVIKVIAAPTQYEPVPIEDGTTILLDLKAHEYCEAEARTKKLLQRLKAPNEKQIPEDEGKCIMVSGAAAVSRFLKSYADVQRSYYNILSWEALCRALNMWESWFKTLSEKLEKGIKIRIITSKPENEDGALTKIRTLKKKGDINVKYLSQTPPLTFAIFDDKEAIFAIQQKLIPSDSANIWTNNKSLVRIVQMCFEKYWHDSD
jgi:sugar-specific transcriptional regulator TrmB